MAAKLFLFGSDQRKAAPEIAKIWNIDLKQQKELKPQRGVSALDALAKEIGQYKELDELVLCFHGYPGGIILENTGYTLSDPSISKAFANTKTKIEHIRFEGCHVGEAPDEMAAFGRLFNAQDVSGYTWASWTGDITVEIPRGNTEKAVTDVLKPFERWLMADSMSTIKRLVSLSRHRTIKQELLLQWFQYSLSSNPPYQGNNYQKYGSHNYKRRSEAAKRTVQAKDAKRSDAPTPTFEYVTVKLR